jgi:DNA-binding PadR family transcriptional regulator
MRGKTNPFPSFEYALLGLLYRGPAHGYELHKLIMAPHGIGMIWGIKISNLYAQLTKLEKAGWIKGEVQAGEDRPARTEFHLTENGRKEFLSWLPRLVTHPRDIRQEFMLRYFFLAQYQPESLAEICQAQLGECRAWLANTRNSQKQMDKKEYPYVIMEFRASQIDSMLAWLEWLIANPVKFQK